jgi:hypothetical protein
MKLNLGQQAPDSPQYLDKFDLRDCVERLILTIFPMAWTPVDSQIPSYELSSSHLRVAQVLGVSVIHPLPEGWAESLGGIITLFW